VLSKYSLIFFSKRTRKTRGHDDRVKPARCHWGGPLDSSEQIRERIVVPVLEGWAVD